MSFNDLVPECCARDHRPVGNKVQIASGRRAHPRGNAHLSDYCTLAKLLQPQCGEESHNCFIYPLLMSILFTARRSIKVKLVGQIVLGRCAHSKCQCNSHPEHAVKNNPLCEMILLLVLCQWVTAATYFRWSAECGGMIT